MTIEKKEDETLDEILNGGLRIFQKTKGYRFSLDALLLAHFASLKKRAKFIDIGCGSGVILFILAKRFPNTNGVGLEIQEKLSALARKNALINHLDSRVEIVNGNANSVKNIFQERTFDSAIFNPPYRKLNSGRINPVEEKAIARHEIKGSLKDFLNAAKYLLKPAGNVFTIYPAKRLVELVYLFRSTGIEPKRMKLIFSNMHSDAVFALVEGKKGGREQLQIEPPLFIYEHEKIHSKDMSAIFNDLSRFPIDGAC